MGRNIEEFELLNTASQLRRAGEHAFDFYRGAIPLDDCHRVMQESYELLGQTAMVKHHLVPLAERWTIDRLRRVGTLGNRLTRTIPEVLFLDAHDTGAGQIAFALLASYARQRVNVSSAGLRPGPGLDPMAAQVLRDIGIDTDALFVKPVTDDAIQAADIIVALGVTIPGAPAPGANQQRLHWDVAELDNETYDVVRAVRDDLDRRVLRLLADILTPAA